MAVKFYRCDLCGNMVGMVHASGVPMICCGQPMTEVVPNMVDAAKEKHLPVVSIDGDTVAVYVGEAAHPMLPEHHIEWIYLQSEQGGQRKELVPGAEPMAVFKLTDHDKAVAAFEYCNLHGLWKKDIL